MIYLVSLSFVCLRGPGRPLPCPAPPTFQPSRGRPAPNATRAANKAECNRDKTIGASNSRSHALYVLHSTLLTVTYISSRVRSPLGAKLHSGILFTDNNMKSTVHSHSSEFLNIIKADKLHETKYTQSPS